MNTYITFLRWVALAIIVDALTWLGSEFDPTDIFEDRTLCLAEPGLRGRIDFCGDLCFVANDGYPIGVFA